MVKEEELKVNINLLFNENCWIKDDGKWKSIITLVIQIVEHKFQSTSMLYIFRSLLNVLSPPYLFSN